MLEGCIYPLDFVNGLPYMKTGAFTDDEWSTLLHIVLTSDGEWDPLAYDHDINNNKGWYKVQLD